MKRRIKKNVHFSRKKLWGWQGSNTVPTACQRMKLDELIVNCEDKKGKKEMKSRRRVKISIGSDCYINQYLTK